LIKKHLDQYGIIDSQSILKILTKIYRRETLVMVIEQLIDKKCDKDVIEDVISLLKGKRQIVPTCFRWGLLCILYLDLFGTRHSSGRADDHGINCANLSLFDVSRLGSSSNKYLR